MLPSGSLISSRLMLCRGMLGLWVPVLDASGSTKALYVLSVVGTLYVVFKQFGDLQSGVFMACSCGTVDLVCFCKPLMEWHCNVDVGNARSTLHSKLTRFGISLQFGSNKQLQEAKAEGVMDKRAPSMGLVKLSDLKAFVTSGDLEWSFLGEQFQSLEMGLLELEPIDLEAAPTRGYVVLRP